MARFRKINPYIWNDDKFPYFSDDAKLLFFTLLTHPNLTMLGAMRASCVTLADDLNWTPDRLTQPFQELLAAGCLTVDERAKLVWLPHFLDYNKIENPNQLKGAYEALELLPECHLKHLIIQKLYPLAERFGQPLPERFHEPLEQGCANKEKEKEKEQEIGKGEVSSSSSSEEMPPIEPPPDAPGKMTMTDIRFVHNEFFGTNMPGGCAAIALEIAQDFSAEAIREAFKRAAEQGVMTMAYVRGILKGNGKKRAPPPDAFDPTKEYPPGSFFASLKEDWLQEHQPHAS